MSGERLSIAITGHRPSGLHDATGRPIDPAPAIADLLARGAARTAATGATRVRFITGGALGIDQGVAAAVLALPSAGGTDHRLGGLLVDYAVVLPFPVGVMGARWRAEDRARLEVLIAGAAHVPPPISERFTKGAYHGRNAAMVDAADVVVAFWTGSREGGTFACLRYALLRARPPRPVWNALDGFRRLHPDEVA